MDKNKVSKEFKDLVYTQDYSPANKIDGVEFIDLKEFSDCGGSFEELVRITKGKVEGLKQFDLRQVNYSVVEPSAIKAFHLHYKQKELWFVPPKEKMLMGLIDARKGSKTEGSVMRFIMGAHKPRLLFIPEGVAHGVGNLYPTRSTVIYFSNQQFNLKKPDEQRLPWDTLGKDFWQIKFE